MAYQEFTDGAGTLWRTWDTRPHSAANVRARYAAGWLCFESDAERRRLGPIPEGWTEASEDDLREWLARAEPTARLVDTGSAATRGRAEGRADGAAPAAEPPVLLERTRAAVARARAVISAVEAALGEPAAPERPARQECV